MLQEKYSSDDLRNMLCEFLAEDDFVSDPEAPETVRRIEEATNDCRFSVLEDLPAIHPFEKTFDLLTVVFDATTEERRCEVYVIIGGRVDAVSARLAGPELP